MTNKQIFTPIQKKRASHLIADKIRESIKEGIYKPGDQLPSERTLSEYFQVSRTIIREGISSLEAVGIVEVIQGKGVYLSSVSTHTLLEYFNKMLHDHTSQLRELLELRRGLEREIIILAIERANAEDIKKIEKAFKAMEKKMQKYEVALDEDFYFHKVIAETSYNTLILEVFNSIVDHYRLGLQEARNKSIKNPEKNDWVLEIHKKLYLAIKNRDKETAVKSSEMLLDHVYQKLISD